MPKENEGQALRDVGNRKKKSKKRRRAVIIALLLLLLVMGAAYLITIYNRNYDSYQILKTTDVTGANAMGYLSYGTSVVKYSKDGAVAIDKDGSLLWNGSFEMSDPIGDTCGKYVAIADRDGKSVHIFDRKGEVRSIPTDYDIIKVEVANQGVVAILTDDDGDGNHIYLYDKDGVQLSDIHTSANDQGYPMDISLSEDGQKLVTSYLSYAGGTLVDNVSFYNFGEVGQNKTDRFVGGFAFDEGIVVPRVEFVNNDTVCAYTDLGIAVYAMKELPDDIFKVTLEGKIQSILFNGTYVGVVVQADGATTRQLLLYDLNGKKVLDKTIDFKYETIYMTDEEIIMYDNMSCVIMKMNGKTKFKYTFDSNIAAIYPINNVDRYYLANESKLYEIQLEE
jgi:hypothetical protein